MAKTPSINSISMFLFFLLHLVVIFLCVSVKSSDIPHAKDWHNFETREVNWEKEQLFPSIHRALIEYFRSKLTEFDSIDPPTTALPSAPITNPVTAPVTTSPGIITVPGTNPGGAPSVPTTTTPVTNPVNPPAPVTSPVNPPVPVINPVTTPTTNPVTTPSTNPGTQPTMNPVTAPSVGNGNGQGGRGQSWCIAKNSASQMALQSALDYACGIGGADCVTIQQGSSCYEPATLQNHASYAFNSYYQKNPSPTSCDFGGAAALTTTNPSTGSCVYPSSGSSSSSPTSTSPTTTPTTTPNTQTPINPAAFPAPAASSSPGSTFPGTQSPPPGFSLGNPDPTGLGAFGANPPLNTASVSNNLRPFIGPLVIVTSIIMLT